MMQSSHTDVIRVVVMVMCYSDSDDSEDNPLVAADEDIDSSDEEQQQQPKQQIKTVEPVQSSGDSDAEEKQETIETKPKQGT